MVEGQVTALVPRVPVSAEPVREWGRCLQWNGRIGSIRPDEGGAPLVVARLHVERPDWLAPGVRVSFERVDERAVRVRPEGC